MNKNKNKREYGNGGKCVAEVSGSLKKNIQKRTTHVRKKKRRNMKQVE